MEDPLNPQKTYLDVAIPVYGASKDELRQLLLKYNQEAAAKIDPDGEVSFDILDESKRLRIQKGKIGHNSPHVGAFQSYSKKGTE